MYGYSTEWSVIQGVIRRVIKSRPSANEPDYPEVQLAIINFVNNKVRESQLTDSKEKTWFVTVLSYFKYIFENEKIKCVSLKVENLSST